MKLEKEINKKLGYGNCCSECGELFEIKDNKFIAYLGENNSIFKCADCAIEYSYPKTGLITKYEIPIETKKSKKKRRLK